VDGKGSVIKKKRFQRISWLYFWVIIFFLGSAGNLIHLVISNYRDYEFDPGWFNFPALVTWTVIAAGMMFYSPLRLHNTRIEGKELDMWEHLKGRKEVIFPWEYNPVATSLAILYYLLSLIMVCIGAYIIAQSKYLLPPKDVLLTGGIFVIGCFLCYLIFKPQAS